MQTVELKKDIYWVGAVDWDLRDFHGYSTENGSSYNAYLVTGEKNVLFDTVKADMAGALIKNISQVIEPEKIDYIVSNHSEMDHTGALPEIIDLVKPDKLICSKEGQKAIVANLHQEDWPFEIVNDGDTLNLGSKTVQFMGTPMLHWPDSMASYIPEDKVLICNDIFGQHWATSERFDDEVDQGELFWQSAKYFVNIFNPTCGAARKFIAKLEALESMPEMLAVDHGLIWRSGVGKIIDAYRRWSNQETTSSAVIIYDTMWESTAKMAEAIGRGIAAEGVSVKLFDLRVNHRSDIMTHVLESRAIILGSPVLNKGILPKMADMLTYMKALKPTGRIGAAFGSYGWADTSVKQLNAWLEDLKIDVVDPGISVRYVPTDDDLANCVEFGERIRKAILEKQPL